MSLWCNYGSVAAGYDEDDMGTYVIGHWPLENMTANEYGKRKISKRIFAIVSMKIQVLFIRYIWSPSHVTQIFTQAKCRIYA